MAVAVMGEVMVEAITAEVIMVEAIMAGAFMVAVIMVIMETGAMADIMGTGGMDGAAGVMDGEAAIMARTTHTTIAIIAILHPTIIAIHTHPTIATHHTTIAITPIHITTIVQE